MQKSRQTFLNAPLTHDKLSVADLARQGQPTAIAAVQCAASGEKGFWQLLHAAIEDHAKAAGVPCVKSRLIVAECDIWRDLFGLDEIAPSTIIN